MQMVAAVSSAVIALVCISPIAAVQAGSCDPGPKAACSGANLAGVDLRGRNLAGADFRGANLRRANLSRANLRGAKLSNADLRRANLSRARLPAAIAKKARLQGANLRGAHLSLTKAPRNQRKRSAQSSPPIVGLPAPPPCAPMCLGANLAGANLSGADLSRDARLFEANLRGANLEGANLEDANMGGADMRGVRAARVRAQGAGFGAYLDGADFTGADLRSTGWGRSATGARFVGADLRRAQLQFQSAPTGAVFDGADMRFASIRDLRGASIQGVRLEGAYLADGSVAGVDFADATLGCDDSVGELKAPQWGGYKYAQRCTTFWGLDLQGALFSGARFRPGVGGDYLSGVPASLPSGWVLRTTDHSFIDLTGGRISNFKKAWIGPGATFTVYFGPQLDLGYGKPYIWFAPDQDFSGLDLRGIQLGRAQLRDARFNGTDLRGADLAEAYLLGASFVDADLTGTDLRGAKFHGANLTGAKGVRAPQAEWSSTTCPDGTNTDTVGTCVGHGAS